MGWSPCPAFQAASPHLLPQGCRERGLCAGSLGPTWDGTRTEAPRPLALPHQAPRVKLTRSLAGVCARSSLRNTTRDSPRAHVFSLHLACPPPPSPHGCLFSASCRRKRRPFLLGNVVNVLHSTFAFRLPEERQDTLFNSSFR